MPSPADELVLIQNGTNAVPILSRGHVVRRRDAIVGAGDDQILLKYHRILDFPLDHDGFLN